jgi:Zn-dependent protease with chaperone function
MNKQQSSVLYGFSKLFLLSALVLLLVPWITLNFSQYTAQNLEDHLISRMEHTLIKEYSIPEKVKLEIIQFFRQNHIAVICHPNNGAIDGSLKGICETYDDTQSQFYKIYHLARWTLYIGGGVFLAVLIFAASAFISRQFQYYSLMSSWWLLMLTAALEAISQGIMMVWLAYWLSAFFLEKIPLQVLFLVGLLAFGLVACAIFAIFKRPTHFMPVEGLPVIHERASVFWNHIHQLAKTMQTEPPSQIIAGIDPNFYVTESGIAANGINYQGRTLYISLPLLKMLSRSEITAILLHELAHFKGGDTTSSAKLGLALQRLEEYCKANLWFFPLRIYLMIFGIARSRDGRDREFMADQAAANQGLAKELSKSLIKFIHYTNFRSLTERLLFAQNKIYQGNIRIAQAIESGIINHDQTREFADSMLAAASPHPFDTHPPLQARLERLGYDTTLVNDAMIAQVPNQDSWYTELVDAEAMEQAIWTEFEKRFKLIHEQDLAYRYIPSDAEEQAIVLKYFPVISVTIQKKQTLQIRYDGLLFPENELFIHWEALSKYQIKDKKITVYYRAPETNKVKKVFNFDSIDQNQLNAALQKYWHRHVIMRQRNEVGSFANF